MSLISKENLNLVLQSLKSLFNKKIKDSIKDSVADWNQNDSSADNYVKNRTHWEEESTITLVEEQTIEGFVVMQEPIYTTVNAFAMEPVIGQTYTVTWDGVSYDAVAREIDGMACIGNENYVFMQSGGDVPFAIIFGNGIFVATESTEGSHTISITTSQTVVHKIDEKYLPIVTPDWNQNDPEAKDYIKNRPFYEEYTEITWVDEQTVNVDESGRAELTKNNDIYPSVGWQYEVVFDGISYTGKAYEDSDMCTHTDFTTDSGVSVTIYDGSNFVSSSELAGEHTIRISYIQSTIHKIDDKYLDNVVKSVNGKTGYINITTSSIGAATTTQVNNKMDKKNPVGTGSFSMNRKSGTTVGQYSHAEGYNTTASGQYSHAEGYNTTASGQYSHVQGKYNVSGNYAHIVGNGTSTTPSNAHTLDWNGVGWYKSGLQVGGNAQDDGAKNVLLEGDAIDIKTWTSNLPTNCSSWSDLVYGNGKFVIIGEFATGDRIYCSENGVTWNETASGSISKLIYCGGKFFVSHSGSVRYSEDGITWTKLDVAIPLTYIAYGNGKFVAKANNQDGIVYYSEDGITWNQVNTPYTWACTALTYGNGKFVTMTSVNEAYYSEDGITWNQTTTPYDKENYRYEWNQLVYADGKFVALADSDQRIALYSEDGIVWTKTNIPIWYPAKTLVYSCGKFIVTTDDRDNNGIDVVCYSEDGMTWKTTTMPHSGSWQTLVCGNDKLIAIDYNNFATTLGVNANAAAYSTDGVNWTEVTLPIVGRWDNISYGNGRFVAIECSTNNASAYYSEDGINWHNDYNELYYRDEAVTDIVSDLIISKRAVPIPTTAQVGQVLMVKAVDENGKPTEWETVDYTVIASSTEGSTKKFKITVDDSGVLSATEIVEEATIV